MLVMHVTEAQAKLTIWPPMHEDVHFLPTWSIYEFGGGVEVVQAFPIIMRVLEGHNQGLVASEVC